MARSQDLSTQKVGLLGRFAFTNGLFELQTTQSGKKQWNVSILFDKGLDLSPLHNLALEAAQEEWGDKAVQMIEDGIIKTPFLDGDGKQGKSKKTGEPHAGFPGTTFIRCTSGEDFRPKVLTPQLLPATKEDIKSGDYGYAVLNAFTWENRENGKGITFGISMAMKAKDGESLGGGGVGAAEDYFEAIPDEGSAPEETKSGDGAAGLFG